MKINHAEPFEQLAHPPIVEALVQINGVVTAAWDQESLVRAVKASFPEFTQLQAMSSVAMTFTAPFGAQGPEAPPAGGVETAFSGVRMTTADGKWVAQLTREFVALSRLSPYEGWEAIRDYAMRLWKLWSDVGGVEQAQRVASRYINRIEVPVADLEIGEYFRGFAPAPGGFEVAGFLHHTALGAPGIPYFVNVIRTHQPTDPTSTTLPLILDLEAWCGEPTPNNAPSIEGRLADLRWVKNKVFFAGVSERLLSLFR